MNARDLESLKALEHFGKRLAKITKNCREDMHEPDEQNLKAVVSGYHLDNAGGSHPVNNYGEYTVGLSTSNLESIDWFNLATLIALARFGATKIEEMIKEEEAKKEA